jgi:hypothetical protein
VQVASWKSALPLIADECAVYAFQCWVRPLVALAIQPSIQVQLLQHDVVDGAVELPHPPAIEPVVALVCRSIYHVEVPTQKPRPRSRLSDVLQLA